MEEEDKGIADKYIHMLTIMILALYSETLNIFSPVLPLLLKVQLASIKRNERDRGLNIDYIYILLVPILKNKSKSIICFLSFCFLDFFCLFVY